MSIQRFEFTFPSVSFGQYQTPWNLEPLLYQGGAAFDLKAVMAEIGSGRLGKPKLERVDLVSQFHEVINAALVGGGSRVSASINIGRLRGFFTWVDDSGSPLSLLSLQQSYMQWTDALVHRSRVAREIKPSSAYHSGAIVGKLVDAVLERSAPIISLTRLQPPKPKKGALGAKAEKQSLDDTFSFGHLLQEICDQVSVEAVTDRGMPFVLTFRNGKQVSRWCRWYPPRDSKYPCLDGPRTRAALANIRIEAELLMFIGQTGMNVGQVKELRIENFRYLSHIDGYRVTEYKERRHGLVRFDIFKQYRPHFERYLVWRKELFPNSELLFPYQRIFGGSSDAPIGFVLRELCRLIGSDFVSPSTLRNTRVNWMLRQSGDPDLTAEIAQHTKANFVGCL